MAKDKKEFKKKISYRLYQQLDEYLYKNTKFLVGKLLTITDSASRDDIQRKALKNLIEDAVYGAFHENFHKLLVRYHQYLAKAIGEWEEIEIEPGSGSGICSAPILGKEEYNPLVTD